jgi:molecular chaperone HtpG
MTVKIESKAEIEAQKAEKLSAFGGLNLLYIKRQLSELLGLIGRDGIFDEYTRHDISHVDKMLGMLDWLIPESTKNAMSCTDWLLTVMGIYFHDLGMLVSKKEFAARDFSGFPQFRDSVLFVGEQGEDYRHKISDLPADQQDRFLYQEFVRHNHAERIRCWISGVGY